MILANSETIETLKETTNERRTMAKRMETSSELDLDLSEESGYDTRGMLPSAEANAECMQIPHQMEVQSPSACDQEPSLQAATSNTPPQDAHDDSYTEGQATEESHHGIAVLGMEVSESVSAAFGESLVLNSDGEEFAIAEPQQESSQQETQPGSSKPSENVLPRNVPPTGVAIVAGGKSSGHSVTSIHKENSKRICDAVSKYYKGQFISHWKSKTKRESSTINNLAALVVEKKSKMKVVILTAGSRVKTECSYFMKRGQGDARESIWGICDGHATAVCYRLVNFYFLTEIYKLRDDGDKGIFEKTDEGYALRQGIKFHLFISDPPCGFMTNKEYHFLSWKWPFEGKPHALQCSSKVLIGAYMGIQGPLSHLFVSPIYISSITMPRYKTVPTLHSTYIMECFDQFWSKFYDLFNPNEEKGGYHFQMPHVEILDVDLKQLFAECFRPAIDEKPKFVHAHDGQLPQQETSLVAKTAKRGSMKVACATTAYDHNSGIHATVFTLDEYIGTHKCHEKVIELNTTLVKLPDKLMQQRLQCLREARVRLSVALNVSEALEGQKHLIDQRMKEKIAFRCSLAKTIIETMTEVMEHKTGIDELTTQVDKLKISLDTIIRNGEVKSVADALTHNLDYQKMLDCLAGLQEMEKSYGSDPEFYLDLMGCDWARYIEAIHNDITLN